MSVMFEVLYKAPPDLARENRISQVLQVLGGNLTYREEPENSSVSNAVVLTYEFLDRNSAEEGAKRVREIGEHVEGPMAY